MIGSLSLLLFPFPLHSTLLPLPLPSAPPPPPTDLSPPRAGGQPARQRADPGAGERSSCTTRPGGRRGEFSVLSPVLPATVAAVCSGLFTGAVLADESITHGIKGAAGRFLTGVKARGGGPRRRGGRSRRGR
jgi:hypothetical protein